MKLQSKLALAMLAVVCAAVLPGFWAMRAVIAPAFQTFERELARSDLERLTGAVNAQINHASTVAVNWGPWDDTYEFVQRPTPGFIATNLEPEVLSLQRVNVMLILDLAGDIVWGTVMDFEDAESPLPPELVNDPVFVATELLSTAEKSVRLHGLVSTSAGVMALAVHPVTTSDLKAAPVGTLVAGVLLDNRSVGAAGLQAGTNYSMQRASNLALAQFQTPANELSALTPGEVQFHMRDNQMSVSGALPAITGSERFILTVLTPRALSTLGTDALNLARGYILVAGLVSVFALMLLLRQFILRPLQRLTRHIAHMRKSGSLSDRLEMEQQDEIGVLAGQFDSLVNDLNGAQGKLVASRDAALELARVKSEFLATMSHEIRTPVNGIMGMAELLMAGKLERGQRRMARTLHRSSTALMNIINNILDFSKISANKLELDSSPMDVRDLVEDLAETFAHQATAKGTELVCAVAPNLKTSFKGDAGRLRQILTNLIGNAIKFTSEGEIVVRIVCKEDNGGWQTLRFEVSDTGIGIKPHKLESLFDPFVQADSSTTRKYGGSGLGLAICKQLIELMEGHIGVDSTPGKGSTFWFDVPLEADANPCKLTGDSLKGVRVLIVDDNATNRQILSGQCENWGANYESVADASTALKKVDLAIAAGDPFDIAVLDHNMPVMSGAELATELYAYPEDRRPASIMLTSVGNSSELETLRADGALRALLSKPTRQADLYRCLTAVLQGRINLLDSTATRVNIESDIVNTGRILVVEDNDVNQQVVCGMLALMGYDVAVANNGREGVEAYRDGNFDAILMDLHMPEMDGLSAATAIRNHEEAMGTTQAIPVIALTADALNDDRERCLAAGMDDYLSKPFTRAQLTATLGRWIDSPDDGQVRDPARESADDSPLDQSIIEQIRELESSTPGLLKKLLGIWVAGSDKLIARARSAASRRDAEDLRVACHTLKSSSANVGAVRLAEICDQLEKAAPSAPPDDIERMLGRLQTEHAAARSAIETGYLAEESAA